jgi:ATP-dependent RNA helicase DbpA
MNKNFASLDLREELILNLKEVKYLSIKSIQAKSLPLILEGRDVIAQAKSGSGRLQRLDWEFLSLSIFLTPEFIH